VYLFYIDESGNPDPGLSGVRADGTTFQKDHIYVLLAVSLFERRWYGFETTLNRLKLKLLQDVSRAVGQRLDLADAEVHSNPIRHPSARQRHRLLSFLTPRQLTGLTQLFYGQLEYNHMHLFAVVIDKRRLTDWMDQ